MTQCFKDNDVTSDFLITGLAQNTPKTNKRTEHYNLCNNKKSEKFD